MGASASASISPAIVAAIDADTTLVSTGRSCGQLGTGEDAKW